MPASIEQVVSPADAAETGSAAQDTLYERAATEFAAPLARLVRAHEADASHQQDLLQEIHLALWRSFAAFGERCSLRTWVYRVAHNVAATHVLRAKRRQASRLVSLDDLDIAEDGADFATAIDESRALARITRLIQRLKPLDRELIILHLEGLPGDEISEIAGLSPANVATKIHRIKLLLADAFGRKDES